MYHYHFTLPGIPGFQEFSAPSDRAAWVLLAKLTEYNSARLSRVSYKAGVEHHTRVVRPVAHNEGGL